MPRFPYRKFFKGLGVSLVVILLLIAGAGEWFSEHYKQIILQKMPGLCTKATDSLYKVSVDNLRINVFTRKVTIYGLRLVPDSAVVDRRQREGRLPTMLLALDMPQVTLANVQWNNALKEKEISAARVELESPGMELYLQDSAAFAHQKIDSARNGLTDIWIKKLRIYDPRIVIHGNTTNDFVATAHGGKIWMDDWKYKPGMKDTDRFFSAASSTMRLDSLYYHRKGRLFAWGAASMKFETESADVTTDGLRYGPVASSDSLYKRIGHRAALYNFFAEHASLQALDWKKALSTGRISGSSAVLSHPSLDIYYSKVPPSDTAYRKGLFPDDMLHRILQRFYIPYVIFKHGSITYRELNDKVLREGVISFNDLDGVGLHITNDPAYVSTPVYLQTAGHLFSRSPFIVSLAFKAGDTTGQFSVNGKVFSVTEAQVKEPVNILAMTGINSLQMRRASLNINGNKDSALGNFTILYDKLRVRLKHYDTLSQRVKGRNVLSFLANAIFLYPSNPAPGERVRNANVTVYRTNDQPFFTFVWKVIFNAIQETAIRNKDLIARFRERKEKSMQKPKKHRLQKWLDRERNRQQSAGKGDVDGD